MSGTWRGCEVGRLSLRADGILHVVFDFSGPSTPEAAEEFLALRAELVGDRIVPVIVEIVQIPYTDRSIRQRFMNSMPTPVCRAVVTTPTVFRVMFQTFELLSPSPFPSRFFNSVDAAAAWIHSDYPDHVRE